MASDLSFGAVRLNAETQYDPPSTSSSPVSEKLKEDPTNEDPTKDPTKEDPIEEDPIEEDLAKEDPTKEDAIEEGLTEEQNLDAKISTDGKHHHMDQHVDYSASESSFSRKQDLDGSRRELEKPTQFETIQEPSLKKLWGRGNLKSLLPNTDDGKLSAICSKISQREKTCCCSTSLNLSVPLVQQLKSLLERIASCSLKLCPCLIHTTLGLIAMLLGKSWYEDECLCAVEGCFKSHPHQAVAPPYCTGSVTECTLSLAACIAKCRAERHIAQATRQNTDSNDTKLCQHCGQTIITELKEVQ